MRVIRRLIVVLAVLVAGLILSVVVLRLTNPRPHASIGWRQQAPMPDPRGEVAAAQIGRRLIVAGGLSGATNTSRTVSVYDARSRAWSRGEPLPAGRHHAAAASDGEYAYLSGGASSVFDWTPHDDVWRASADAPWKPLARMPEGRQSHAMVHVEGRLYVVGGVGSSDDTLIYDIEDDRWTRGAPIPAGRDHLRAVEWGGRVWALAGRSGDLSRRADVYDPDDDVWTRGPDLPSRMSAMAVGVVRGELHVIGGEDPHFFSGGVDANHYALKQKGDGWIERSTALLPVHGAAAGVFERSLIIAGGASRNGALSVLSWTDVTQTFTP